MAERKSGTQVTPIVVLVPLHVADHIEAAAAAIERAPDETMIANGWTHAMLLGGRLLELKINADLATAAPQEETDG